jgi:hypothetical protein
LREAAQRIADLVPGNGVPGAALPRAEPPRAEPPRAEPLRAELPRAAPPRAAAPAIATPGREPRAVVWLEAERSGLARALADKPTATALVSARALAGSAADDAAFVWASAADRAQLLGWIEATSAREVFVTGPCAEAIVSALGGRARLIGPPQQMSLFPGEALT